MPLYSLLRRLPPLLAGAFLASCSLPNVTPSLPSAERGPGVPRCQAGHLRRARATLQKLETERTLFLRSGDPRKIFSVFYRHVTAAILERAEQGVLREPDAILEMVVEFHRVYERNRFAAQRDAHWQPYYELADGVRNPDFKTGRAIIQRGVDAHIDHDLPVILRQTLRRHPELQAAGGIRLKQAMDDLSGLFLPCSALGFADLAAVLPDAPGPRSLGLQSRIAYTIIRRKRERAWWQAMREFR